MQRSEVSDAVRPLCGTLGFRGLSQHSTDSTLQSRSHTSYCIERITTLHSVQIYTYYYSIFIVY